MSNESLRTFLGRFRRELASSRTGETTDAELVDRFFDCGDADAFELLLWRYERMVLGVCRHILADPHDAEDAFQATFLTFVRKGRALANREVVAAWIHRVACRTALTLRARRAKRDARERRFDALREPEGPAIREAHALPAEHVTLLHEAIARLPERDRAPLVLCYLEGKTLVEAGRVLGCPRGTVASRLARARERLRNRLRRLGLTLPMGAIIAGLLELGAVSAAPAALVSATTRAAKCVARGEIPTGLVSPQAVAAFLEVSNDMASSSLLKFAAAALLLVGALATGAHFSGVFAAGQERLAGAEEPNRAEPVLRVLKLGEHAKTIALSPDGTRLAVRSVRTVKREGAADKFDSFATVKVFELKTAKEVVSLGEIKNSGLVDVGFSPDGNTLILSFRLSIQEGDKVEFWDARTGRLANTIEMDYGRVVPKFTTSPDGRTLAVLDAGDRGRDPKVEGLQGGVRLWDVGKGESVRWLRGHKHLATALAFAPDGKRMATGGDTDDQTVRLWEVGTGKTLWTFAGTAGVSGLQFSPDGKLLAATQGREVTLIDTATGKAVRSLSGGADTVRTAAFNRSGRLLLGTGEVQKDGKKVGFVEVWTVDSGASVWTRANVRSAALAPNGFAVVLEADGIVRVFNPAVGGRAGHPFAQLVGELINGQKSDGQVAEALYLAILGRYPTGPEDESVREHLAKQKDRRVAIEEAVFALTSTTGYLDRLRALSGNGPQK